MWSSSINSWDLDLDRWFNPYIPRNHVARLPAPISRFLGHGSRAQIGNVLVAWWSFFGAFAGVVIIEAALMIPEIHNHGVPIVIASFGAAAILEYNFIESPLAQPRNSILGHLVAAIVGVCVTKLFSLNANFEDLRWLAGALACGLASAAMVFAKAVYPPAGATALLAAVDPAVSHLGWYLLPVILLSSALTLILSLLINNIQRRYPTFWWTPADLGKTGVSDIEKLRLEHGGSERTESTHTDLGEQCRIVVSSDTIFVPSHIQVTREEGTILELLRNRLRENTSIGEAT